MTICILGRQPALGMAELESVFGANNVTRVSEYAASVDVDAQQVAGRALGGSIKIAKHLTTLNTQKWDELITYCATNLPTQLGTMPPEGKIKLGLSEYGLNVPIKKINATGLTLKKSLKQAGRSVRIIPNQDSALNSATVLHNKLTAQLGVELLFVQHGSKTIIAQTVAVQDIESYAYRDRNRPKRDAFVGMLPPKLAQIMINLAAGSVERVTPGGAAPEIVFEDASVKKISGADQAAGPATKAAHQPPTLLDPFCGTGVLLMEAALMGYTVYGSDLSEKMVDYSNANLHWLAEKYNLTIEGSVKPGDATDHTWQKPIDIVACETYLGQPLSGLPKPEKLQEIIQNCNIITKKFLQNLSKQVKPGSTHCIAVPAWHVHNNFKHLPLLRDLQALGFEQKKLTHASHADLIYFRPDQIVARELLVITKL